MSAMRVCVVVALLCVAASAIRATPKKATPDWACDLKAGPKAWVAKNSVFPSGDAAQDKADGEAILKIVNFRRAETETEEKNLLKKAGVEAEIGKKEMAISKDLSDKAKLEMRKDTTQAEKDSAASNKAISDGAKAVQDAKDAVAKAKTDAKATKEETKTWEEDAKFLKASAVVEKQQKVVAGTSATLAEMVAKKDKDTLVVFYAPWCPHCQTFVMHDESGNAEKAPLELFNQELKKAGALETLNLVKYDTQSAGTIPAGFDVQYLPTVYMATHDGKYVAFEGNPHSIPDLKSFIKTNAPQTKGI
jgi:thiol-disulfide isomerase/thioredoxin